MLKPIEPALLTAEEFIERKFDLAEGGRWMELHHGVVQAFDPPDDLHGNAVRNLSRSIAESARQQIEGYACFDLGFILARDPDSVYFPPISYITTGVRFGETDEIATERKPVLVIEIASTHDRRRGMSKRVQHYLNWGVPNLWVVDTSDRTVQIFQNGCGPITYQGSQIINAGRVLGGFDTTPESIFADPEWWNLGSRRNDDSQRSAGPGEHN